MADYDNNMRGVLFRNDRQENDKQPGYTGKIEIDGVEYRLSAWVKEGKKGKFFSLAVQQVERREEYAPPTGTEDLPF